MSGSKCDGNPTQSRWCWWIWCFIRAKSFPVEMISTLVLPFKTINLAVATFSKSWATEKLDSTFWILRPSTRHSMLIETIKLLLFKGNATHSVEQWPIVNKSPLVNYELLPVKLLTVSYLFKNKSNFRGLELCCWFLGKRQHSSNLLRNYEK